MLLPAVQAGQHGFITGQVTKELQSNTPSAMPAMPSEPQAPVSCLADLTRKDGGSRGLDALTDGLALIGVRVLWLSQDDGGERRLLGVARDKWSLFWDAYVQPNPGSQQAQQAQQAASGSPPPSSLLAGFRQEAVYLGKFPTQQQAGRAHDIAALKLHGTGAQVGRRRGGGAAFLWRECTGRCGTPCTTGDAGLTTMRFIHVPQTNFPVEQYTRTLPALQTHTEEQVLQALRKDAALALQRTSK